MLGKPRDPVAAGQAGDDGGPSGGSERGLLPWPPVAAGLLALLAVLLAVGLVANGRLRPGPAGTPVPPATMAAQAVPSVVASQPPLAVGGAAGTPPAAQPAAAAVVPSASALPPASALASAPPSVPPRLAVASPSVASPSPAPTLDPELAQEVGRAYEQYWQVRADALLSLDTSRLSEVSQGLGRAVIERGIDELRSESRAIKTRVEHDYHVISVSNDTAEVADQYIDKSIYVDAVSGEPLQSDYGPDGPIVKEIYQMQRIGGTWKVIGGAIAT